MAEYFHQERGHIMIENANRLVVGEFPPYSPTYHSNMVYAFKELYERTGEGADMLGWLDWPKVYLESDEYKRLKKTAQKIRDDSNAVVVIGIGGSYLTPQMVIQSEYGEYYNESTKKNSNPAIYFAGCDLSPDKLKYILDTISDVEWSVIYISKSGGTMEPALAFRIFWEKLLAQYGDDANKRVYAITDAEKGVLKSLANEHGWESFVIPDDIGGRYSGFTACGLLPVAVAGIDTDKLLQGAIQARHDWKDTESFPCQYAEWRFYNYAENFSRVEFFATNSPWLSYTSEWLKQLFGESEGKNQKGLFPASGVFPTDLHSLGQYLQDGLRDLILETFIIRDFKGDIEIPSSSLKDNLNERTGKKYSQAAAAAMDGAYKAHTAGGNACAVIKIQNSLEALGYFMYSMFVTCAISAYMLKVNPFNQPGVESHKDNMKVSPEWDK